MRNYQDPVYKDWRKSVYKRDSHKCQMPGCRSRSKKINAHHIRKWSEAAYLRYDLSNGITLCWKCHKEVTGSERQYEALFMQIVRENGTHNT